MLRHTGPHGTRLAATRHRVALLYRTAGIADYRVMLQATRHRIADERDKAREPVREYYRIWRQRNREHVRRYNRNYREASRHA